MVEFDVEKKIDMLLNGVPHLGIPPFSKRIRENAIHDSELLSSDINKWIASNEDKKIQIESSPSDGSSGGSKGSDGGDVPSIFRINFRLPVYLLNDKSFNEIRKACFHGYFRDNNVTRSMSNLIPVYNLNLNHITVLRTYGKKAIQRSSDNITEEASDFVCKKYVLPETASPKKMQMSSMNFLLPGSTKEEAVDELWTQYVRSCYRYLCWNPPLEHFDLSTIHSLFLHSSKHIFGIAKVYKTIAKIERINKGRRDVLPFANRKYNYAEAKANMIFQDKEKIFARRLHIWIAEPYASELQEGDLVNCIVMSPVVWGGHGKYKTLIPTIMGVAGKIKNPFSIIGHLVGMFTWKKNQKFDKNTELTKVSGSDELFGDIWSFVQKSGGMFDLDMHDARDAFDKYIDMKMFFLRDSDGLIWQVPAPLWAFMIHKEMKGISIDELSIFNETISSIQDINWKRKLRMSEKWEKIQTGPRKQYAGDLMRYFPRIANRMVYSRLISKSSTDASLR